MSKFIVDPIKLDFFFQIVYANKSTNTRTNKTTLSKTNGLSNINIFFFSLNEVLGQKTNFPVETICFQLDESGGVCFIN